MHFTRSQLKKKKQYALSRAAEKWNELRPLSGEERRQALNQHALAFRLDDIGAGWEYVHFELDQKSVEAFRISYIGPDVNFFISELENLKEEDSGDIVFCDEPGEYPLFFARKKDRFAAEMEKFVAALQGKGEIAATGEDGVIAMRLLDAIYKSSELDQEVTV